VPGGWCTASPRLVSGRPLGSAIQGPNSGPIWTDAAQVDRSELYTCGVFSTAKKTPEPVITESTVIVSPEEPAGSLHLYAFEAPLANYAWGIS
jgi:hypothetical protein